MEIAIIIILIFLLIYKQIKTKPESPNEKIKTTQSKENITLPIKGFYKPKWLFTYNEKDAFKKLKTITDKYGLTLLAKVRILDLAEPIKNNQKYKTYLYKIQSKHVDFVICDPKLVARCIIELDDNSHNTPERKQRDEFVDNVLSSVGYQILHVRAINIESIEATIAEIFIHNK